MEVRRPRHPVGFAALLAGMFAVQTAAQESRPRAREPLDLTAVPGSDEIGIGMGEPPPVAPRDVRVHVLDAEGRPWGAAEPRVAVVAYRTPAPRWNLIDRRGRTWSESNPASATLNADGVAVLRDASQDAFDAVFLDRDFGGIVRIEAAKHDASSDSVLCAYPLRRLRLRGRTSLGAPLPLDDRIRETTTASGPAVFLTRPDLRLTAASRSDPFSSLESDGEELWRLGAVCPNVPLTVRAVVLGRSMDFEVPAGCEVFEAPINGLGQVAFLTASHNRWTLIYPSIGPRRTHGADSEDAWDSWPPIAHWLDKEPIKDGYVGRRRALMWPGTYRVTPYGGQPVEFEVRADETVEVPLP